MSARFQKGLLIFFIIGIAALLYGLWAITPRTPQPGSCLILEQKYCDQAQETILDVNGIKAEYLVFNLPSETPVFASIDGLLVKAKESGDLSGFVAQIRNTTETGGAAIFRGDIKFDDMLQKNVTEGSIIAHIGDTGVKIGKDSFNLAFTTTKRTPEGPVVDEDKLKQLFPKAFEKL